MRRLFLLTLVTLGLSTALSPAFAVKGNPDRGQRIFNACAACHSLEPNRSMTGPSLADLWNRKAGSLASFPRYSSELRSSGIVWNDKTLDDWIKDPQHFIPGNDMTFQGIKDDQQRVDLLASQAVYTIRACVATIYRRADGWDDGRRSQSEDRRSGISRASDQLLPRHLSCDHGRR